MRQYTERELEQYERSLSALRNLVLRQQDLIDQLANPKALDLAWSLLEQMTETLNLFEEKRVRILVALTEEGPTALTSLQLSACGPVLPWDLARISALRQNRSR